MQVKKQYESPALSLETRSKSESTFEISSNELNIDSKKHIIRDYLIIKGYRQSFA